MGSLMHFIREYTVWLHYTLFEYGLFYIDLWSVVHFWSGLIVLTALSALNWKNRWKWLAFFLFAFEVVEATIFIAILKMFMPEKLPDSFTDIFVGLAGGYLVYLLFEKWKIPKRYSKLFLFLLTSATLGFLWAGNYSYKIGDTGNAVPGLNWLAFGGWTVLGIAILYLYEKLKNRSSNRIKPAAITWVAYLPVVLLFMVVRSNFMYAGEAADGGNGSLAQYIPAHGTDTLFYLVSPLLFIFLYRTLNALFESYFRKYNIGIE